MRYAGLLVVAAVATATAQAPAFDAASIKPSPRDAVTSTSTFFFRSQQLSIVNHPMRLLMAIAFGLDVNKARSLIVGLPGWADNEGWDIQAAAADAPSTQQKRVMLQALLADRFKLAYHRETRQLPVFALVAVNPERMGPQFRRHPDDTTCEPAPVGVTERTARAGAGPFEQAWVLVLNAPCGRITGGILQNDRTQAWAGGRRVSLATFAGLLGEQTPLELPVVLDRTGLEGVFDVAMVWNPQQHLQELASPGADADALTFTRALREQLGLTLRRETGPVEVIVIDRVERPIPD